MEQIIQQIMGLIAIVLFIGSLFKGIDVVPGCIGSLAIAAISYIPLYLITTYWKEAGIILVIIIGVIALIGIFAGRKDNNYNLAPSKVAVNREDTNNRYLKLEKNEKKKPIKVVSESPLLSEKMKYELTSNEKNFLFYLQQSKGLTLEKMVRLYRSFYYFKDGEPFMDYDEITLKKMASILSMNNSEESLHAAIKRVLEKEMKDVKKKYSLKVEYLEEIGALIYIERFIITSTMKFDMEDIQNKTYDEKLQELIKFLKYKFSSTLTFEELNDIIQLKKHEIYSKHFMDKLNYDKSKPVDEVVSDYITVFGNLSDKSFYIKQLSILINLSKGQTRNKVNEVKDKIRIQYKASQFEKELFQEGLSIKLEEIDELNGYEFEDYLVELFSNFGYDVLPTSYSGDQGADLIIQDLGRKIVIQAKNYSGSVGNKAIQEALAAKHHYNCDTAMVITNAYFTKPAQELAETTKVILIDRDKLEDIIKQGKVAFLNYL